MPEQDPPDFSFLNEEQKKGDSAILENVNQPPENEPVAQDAQSEQNQEDEDSSQPAWMDDVQDTDSRYDTMTRFTDALSLDESKESQDFLNLTNETNANETNTNETNKSEEIKSQESETLAENSEEITEPEITEESLREENSEGESSRKDIFEQKSEPEDGSSIFSKSKFEPEEKFESEELKRQEDKQSSFDANEEEKDESEAEFTTAKTVTTEAAIEETPATIAGVLEEKNDSVEDQSTVNSSGEVVAGVAAIAAGATLSQPSPALAKPVVSKQLFVLAVSYASAVTLICGFLLMQSMMGKPHELESLPDLKPPMKDDQVAYRLVPESVALPPGHTLNLGQSRRFGNVRVTAVKVVREPIKFVHYSESSGKSRSPSSPTMKLWLKFENVSNDQKFAPIDRKLMLTRLLDPKEKVHMRSNQCLSSSSNKGDISKTNLLYDLELLGDWNFAGIDDDPIISPGESLDVYLPADENAFKKMQGKIVWRVQFRKGYHPVSRRGVTTLIEIVFNKADVILT